MTVPSTVADFLVLVRKSNAVVAKRLDDYLASLSSTGAQARDPRRLAARLVRDGILSSFQAEQLLQGKWRGFLLGKYRILEKLGAGGMGAVFLCEHTLMNHRVAIKVLPTEKARDPAALGRFYREARAAAGLDHPNIVRAYDIDQDGDRHFLVMEYVEGTSLQELVSRRGPLDHVRAAHYVRQAAFGLQRAHDAGLVHRDVKPSNLLVDRAGIVKVADLGLARFFHDDLDALTREHDDGAILGSADYFAPEQALDSHDVDIRADIYALGCTLYFLLAGQPPFAGATTTQKLLWHQVKSPPPVQVLRPDVPVGLAEVLNRMMAKKPGDRFQTPAAVAHALEPWTESPIAPPSETDFRRLSPAAQGTGSGDTRAGPGSSRTKITYPLIPEVPRVASSPSPTAGEPFSWDRLDTAISYGGTPTEAPAGGNQVASNRPRSGSSSALQPPLPRRLQYLVVAVGLLVGFGGAAAWWAMDRAPRNQGRGKAGSPGETSPSKAPAASASLDHVKIRLRRARTAQEEGFEDLWTALGKAEPGDHLRVQSEFLEELLILRGDGKLGRDLTIEGRTASGDPVVWRPPAAHGKDQPLVALSNTPGIRFIGFILDGQDRVDDLIALSEHCAGLQLHGLQFRGFLRSAVKFHNCEGECFRPVSLRGLAATAGTNAETALLFETADQGSNQHIEVYESRFVGRYQAAARIVGPIAHVVFRHNRFFQGSDGMRFVKSGSPGRVHFCLEGNTFAEFDTGLHWEAVPPDTANTHVHVRNNLFMKTKTLAATDGIRPQPGATQEAGLDAQPWQRVLAATGNVRDRAGSEGVPSLESQPGDFTLSSNPDEDATFLRYTATSPLAVAGGDRSPVGVPPASHPPPTPVIVVINREGKEQSCRSVRDALLLARSGERVVVRGDTLQETLILWGKDGFVGNVVLEGQTTTGKPLVWRPADDHPATRPLIHLTDLVGLTVKGITFDGGDRVQDLFILAGYCPGVVLEDVHLRGFRRVGLTLRDCTGLPDRPAVLRRVRWSTILGADAALTLEAERGHVSQFIRVQDCRLEGPYLAATRVGCSVSDVQFERNRVHRATDGLLFKKAEPQHQIGLTLNANTFLDVRRILRFEAMPAADTGNRLVLRNNLFARPDRLVEVEGFAFEPPKVAAKWIWFPDDADLLKQAPTGTRHFRKPFDVPEGATASAVLNIVCDDTYTVWLNGKEVGKGQLQHDQRVVEAHDVLKHLQPGKNVLAVSCTNQGGAAGLLVQLTLRDKEGKEREIVSDDSWRTSTESPQGWQGPSFDDQAWKPTRVVTTYDKSHNSWRFLVWKSQLDAQSGKVLWPLAAPPSAGNVSCQSAGIGGGYCLVPVSGAGHVTPLGIDPNDDATYLRYPRENPLIQAGENKTPVGVPPAK